MGKSRLEQFTKYEDFTKIPQRGGALNSFRGVIRGQRGSGLFGSLLSTALKVGKNIVKHIPKSVTAAAHAAAPVAKEIAKQTTAKAVDHFVNTLSQEGVKVNKTQLKKKLKSSMCGNKKKKNKPQKGGSAKKKKKKTKKGKVTKKKDRLG